MIYFELVDPTVVQRQTDVVVCYLSATYYQIFNSRLSAFTACFIEHEIMALCNES